MISTLRSVGKKILFEVWRVSGVAPVALVPRLRSGLRQQPLRIARSDIARARHERSGSYGNPSVSARIPSLGVSVRLVLIACHKLGLVLDGPAPKPSALLWLWWWWWNTPRPQIVSGAASSQPMTSSWTVITC